ncbi:MAG: large subunit ribosomal protein L19 [Rickettsiales bacterium]|jgi:large subunit ribosomal protein L19
MVNIIEEFQKQQVIKINESRGGLDKFVPNFKSGDTLAVKYKITEGGNVRLQTFTGVVIARSKSFNNFSATFTIRKMSGNIGVERKFILYSGVIAEIKLLKEGIIRRSKLYYLRNLTGKAARIREKISN